MLDRYSNQYRQSIDSSYRTTFTFVSQLEFPLNGDTCFSIVSRIILRAGGYENAVESNLRRDMDNCSWRWIQQRTFIKEEEHETPIGDSQQTTNSFIDDAEPFEPLCLGWSERQGRNVGGS